MSERVLVLGDFRQTVTVVRSLARAGFRVTLGCDDPDSSTARSRYVADVWLYERSGDRRFCGQLADYLRRARPDLVFTVGETLLRRVIKAQGIEALATWVNPEPATLERCFDKSALYELGPRIGIPTLPWRAFTSAEDWRSSARRMGYPVVVKRKDSAAQVQGRKALILAAPAELERFLARLHEDPNPGTLVLQKYFAGVRHNCHVACADGRIICYFQQKVLSTDEPDGTGIGTAGVSVRPSAELRAYSEGLTQALQYTGIGCIQFLVDERTGGAAFLEFNARMDSTAALPYRLGYDYPRLAVELARYRRRQRDVPQGPARPYALGRTYHWLLGDLGAWISTLRKRRSGPPHLLAWAADMAWMSVRSHHLTFEWRDPLPTLHMYWRYFGRPLLRRVLGQPRAGAGKPLAPQPARAKPT